MPRSRRLDHADSDPHRGGGRGRPGTGRWLEATIVTIVASLALAACSSAAPRSADERRVAAASETPLTTEGCPQQLVQSMAQQHGPNQESDLATLDTTLGVTLPTEPVCVLTNDGDTEGSTAYYAFFPKQEAAFATTLKTAFAKAGYRPTSDGNDYDSGAASGRVDTYAAGDDNWTEYFGGAAVVLLAGQFDGIPGATAAPLPGSGSTPMTWESSCMLSVAEIDAAWASKEVRFEGPAAADSDSTACEYSQTGKDLPIRIDVDFRPYSPSGSYGWGTSGSSWTAPNAAEGASNACEAARSGTSTNGLEAICTKVGTVRVVIGTDRLKALVFRPGDYFTVVDLFNVGGDDSLTGPLKTMTKLLAARGPVGS